MELYEQQVFAELREWKKSIITRQSVVNGLAMTVQAGINKMIPDRVHDMVTRAIRQMTKTVIFGARLTTSPAKHEESLSAIETNVRRKIDFYSKTAAAEGAVTGYGGILLGLVDLPLWLSIKIKMLFEIASLYGHDLSDYKERIYLLHVFQLTFSSSKQRQDIFNQMKKWNNEKEKLPVNLDQFDWRTFQLEYRDYLDLPKLMQLIPGFGALVGFYVNQRLTRKLGNYAMNAYRMRRFKIS
ncbi:MAG: EcsC family protein [Cyclobacteriaceae bacterium]|nr:EcsC family protein [Cyclobacteriaceae bacterium]